MIEIAIVRDIAKRANVSIATVSNVLNNTSRVKDETRARVLQAVQALGYHTEIAEKQNRAREMGTLGIIMEDVTVFNTPEIYTAICETAGEMGYATLACNLGLVHTAKSLSFDDVFYLEPAQRAVNLLLSKGADGIIYVGSQSREIKHISSGYSAPFVYAYCFSNEEKSPSIVYDDENVTHQLIHYLIECGHRNIGIIAGLEDSVHVRARLMGFQRALFEAGILYNPGTTYFGDWESTAWGYECAGKLTEAGVTAIFCMNDTLAGGVIDYALINHIAIPQELSVVGFDNIIASSAYYPKLTTVALPLMDIGREAVRQLVKLIQDPNNSNTPYLIEMPCSIVYRDSVATRSE